MRATNNRTDSLTAVDGTQLFLTSKDAEQYANGAGWTLLTHQTDPVIAVRDDIPDVQYKLQAMERRYFWKRDWLGCDTARSRVV